MPYTAQGKHETTIRRKASIVGNDMPERTYFNRAPRYAHHHESTDTAMMIKTNIPTIPNSVAKMMLKPMAMLTKI